MKKLLAIVVLGLLWTSYSSAEEKFTRLKFFDSKVIVTGDEWGGEVFILGPGSGSKKKFNNWVERVKFVEKNIPQNEFCTKFGLKAKEFSFKDNMEDKTTMIQRRKYQGKREEKVPGTDLTIKTRDYDRYSSPILIGTHSKFECDNNKPKPSELTNSLADELEKLKKLYKEGTLSKQQFEKAKNKLLN